VGKNRNILMLGSCTDSYYKNYMYKTQRDAKSNIIHAAVPICKQSDPTRHFSRSAHDLGTTSNDEISRII
jgi:hypothetical protein